jgi:16S rRNA (guanine527-N7)-methyltransferase
MTDDARDELATLVARYQLNAQAEERLGVLVELLGREGAPTSVHDPVDVVHDHLADSLAALEIPELNVAGRVADLGAGAGLPGLCLAVVWPDTEIVLVESNARKCRFIEHAVDALDLSNALVLNARAEIWDDGIETCDVVTARALARLDVVAEYAAPLLTPRGTLAVWRGRRDQAEEAAASRAADVLGLEVLEPRAVTPYPGAAHRHIHLMLKRDPTPPQFPRRPGMAQKRPLGGRIT